MKVTELSGAMLDYWVARANGWRRANFGAKQNVLDEAGEWWSKRDDVVLTVEVAEYTPSFDWSQGGPIIDRERINVCEPDHSFGAHGAETRDWCAFFSRANGCMQHGPTPLIAAMRAYVASKFGDTVEDI